MAIKSIQGNKNFANKIKNRRNELGLTIEQAAKRAGVGTKTWCRYEAGESIRQDKYRGVCKALNWIGEMDQDEDVLDISEYRNHEAWSAYLEQNYGEVAAASFAIGSDLLLDYVKEDMAELLKMPQYSHIGQIDLSMLVDILPQQFCMRYDYDFLYALYTTIYWLRSKAHSGMEIIAHSVLEELAIYLMVQESQVLLESNEELLDGDWDEWVFDLFDDMDIITYLYSDQYLTKDDSYHFDHWMENQFYSK